MKNFIFISPNFPENYYLFCMHLKNNGMNVLGIGDQPYDELLPQLKESLTEYYKVDSLENYDDVYRACAYFAFKYGRIDWLESNNEYWLMQDASLRTDFNIPTGFHTEDMTCIKYKSAMKANYAVAGIPTARYHLVQAKDDCLEFIREVGYPVVVKPDNGVGASHTYKLKCENDLDAFLSERAAEYPDVPFIMEEYVNATVNSYDAIVNLDGEVLFETGNVTLDSIMDTVNDEGNSLCYIRKDLPEDIREAGRKTLKAFHVRGRFIHLEFFRLNEDQEGLGKKGAIVGLEVNMRPAGVFLPDMMNYAHTTDVYKIWADMVVFGHSETAQGEHKYCAFIGRRDSKDYKLTDETARELYPENIIRVFRLPEAMAAAMGNVITIASFTEEEDMMAFLKAMGEINGN
ncbi:MAG: carbamoylphosphate synthase large subunit [Eubacteriales bacterium]|nr:carbamoylphosphate synthase large subunit [Eubacteriales bacterium]